jgi:hypothetical protein
MSSDDKKIKTSPAPKNEVASKDKSTSSVDTSKVEGGRLLTLHPPAIAEGRARNRLLKLIRTTGTRFSRRTKKR